MRTHLSAFRYRKSEIARLNLFQALNSQLLKLCIHLSAAIRHIFISFSAVQIVSPDFLGSLYSQLQDCSF